MDNLKSMAQMLRSANDPKALVQNMLSQSPYQNEILGYINAANGDYRAAFYAMAKQRGVDPEQFLNALR